MESESTYLFTVSGGPDERVMDQLAGESMAIALCYASADTINVYVNMLICLTVNS